VAGGKAHRGRKADQGRAASHGDRMLAGSQVRSEASQDGLPEDAVHGDHGARKRLPPATNITYSAGASHGSLRPPGSRRSARGVILGGARRSKQRRGSTALGRRLSHRRGEMPDQEDALRARLEPGGGLRQDRRMLVIGLLLQTGAPAVSFGGASDEAGRLRRLLRDGSGP